MNRVQIKSVHIKNYRSIKDSGKIAINGKVTVFAGKNESGKTNILKAIESFYKDEFCDDDIPVNDLSSNPQIKINFEFSREYILAKIQDLKAKIKLDKISFVITRSKDKIDELDGSIVDVLTQYLEEKIEANDNLKGKLKNNNFKHLTQKLINSVEEDRKKVLYEYLGLDSQELQIQDKEDVENLVLNFNIEKIIAKLIPQIAFFDSFEDMLPDELSKVEIVDEKFESTNKAFANLLLLLQYDKEDFIKKIEGNQRGQSAEFKQISEKITEKYNNTYLQEKISIGLNKNGDKVFVQIFDEKDKTNDTKPSQRSKGFQWFLSFYLLLNSLNDDAIILIDEPGLYLHSKAQSDILQFLNYEIPNTIMFTTHSPYLINIDKLNELRLVEKNSTGTKIIEKYYNCKELDTTTPLITAIGYSVGKNPFSIGNGKVLFTEGISDRFYVLSFLKLLGKEGIISIMPATGSSKVHNLVSFGIGWNLNYKILLDDDQGGKEAIINLKELYCNEEELDEKIIYAIKNGTIEKNFSAEDRKKYNISSKKVISSYNFYEKVIKSEIVLNDLTDETQKNIKKLIDNILK